MIDVISDTETSGKWDFKAPFEAKHQPTLVQLAFRVVEDDKCISTFSSLVSDCGRIEPEASKVTGLTEGLCERFGFKAKTVLTFFLKALEKADTLVFHNAQFDRLVLLKALRDSAMPWWRDDLPVLCTMRSSTNLLKLPGKFGKWKWPTLDEAYRALVAPEGFSGAHDALVDVDATWSVLRALRRAGQPIERYDFVV